MYATYLGIQVSSATSVVSTNVLDNLMLFCMEAVDRMAGPRNLTFTNIAEYETMIVKMDSETTKVMNNLKILLMTASEQLSMFLSHTINEETQHMTIP